MKALAMIRFSYLLTIISWLNYGECRDEEKILKACYWPNEIYEPCFGGCAEVTCDNPRNHLRPCYPYCEPGCVCEDPYIRDDRTHQCVLTQDCSPTQMGIPVPSKVERRSDRPSPSQVLPSKPQYSGWPAPRSHSKHDDQPDFAEDILPQSQQQMQPMQNLISSNSNKDIQEFKRPSEVSRMGNYFNIVIAPPPIKALQPRKMLNNGYVPALKRLL